jgi:hypothetical protein
LKRGGKNTFLNPLASHDKINDRKMMGGKGRKIWEKEMLLM